MNIMDYISHFKQNTTIILLGAGDSTRFSHHNLPKKQWLRSGQKPLWQIVYERFLSLGFTHFILTASKRELSYMQSYTQEQVVCGGNTRSLSILNALEQVKTPYVLINDIARWNIQPQVIQELFSTLYHNPSASCIAPALEAVDTIFCTQGYFPPRSQLKLIQTPQLSKTQILQTALLQDQDFSDESSAIFSLKEEVIYTQGSPLMNKLTTPQDLQSLSLSLPSKQIFVGNGLDIHAFEEGKVMVLGGVEINSPLGFKAHSDGDVVLHSVIDAILGAIGGGDIGEWFPDTQETYKNADSKQLAKEIVDFSRSVGYEIINLDITILAQFPKISPYKTQIKQSLSSLLSLPLHKINIKATTGENLGFVGRKEGVCVMSSVSMQFIDWSKSDECLNYRK